MRPHFVLAVCLMVSGGCRPAPSGGHVRDASMEQLEGLAIDYYSKELGRSLERTEICAQPTSYPGLARIGYYMYDGGCINQRFVWEGRVLGEQQAVAAVLRSAAVADAGEQARRNLMLDLVREVLLPEGGSLVHATGEQPPCTGCEAWDTFHPPRAHQTDDGSTRVRLWIGVRDLRAGVPLPLEYSQYEVVFTRDGQVGKPTRIATHPCWRHGPADAPGEAPATPGAGTACSGEPEATQAEGEARLKHREPAHDRPLAGVPIACDLFDAHGLRPSLREHLQNPSAPPAAWPKAGTPIDVPPPREWPEVSIAELIAEGGSGGFRTSGWVLSWYEAPPCPPSAMCKPRPPRHVVLAPEPGLRDGGPKLTLRTADARRLANGRRYDVSAVLCQGGFGDGELVTFLPSEP